MKDMKEAKATKKMSEGRPRDSLGHGGPYHCCPPHCAPGQLTHSSLSVS